MKDVADRAFDGADDVRPPPVPWTTSSCSESPPPSASSPAATWPAAIKASSEADRRTAVSLPEPILWLRCRFRSAVLLCTRLRLFCRTVCDRIAEGTWLGWQGSWGESKRGAVSMVGGGGPGKKMGAGRGVGDLVLRTHFASNPSFWLSICDCSSASASAMSRGQRSQWRAARGACRGV